MASSSLGFNPIFFPSVLPISTRRSFTSIRCGPRDNRGPLVKGRILSTEAIQAIHSLKRAYRNSSPSTTNTQLPSLSRLIKSDLIAALRELLRQDQCTLVLHVLSTVRADYPPPDLALYADVVVVLARNRLGDDINGLIGEMEVMECDDEKAVVRLIKGVIEAGDRESTVRIVGMMKKNGVGSRKIVGEYIVNLLSKGLRRFGEVSLALEVEREFGELSRAKFDKLRI